MRNKTIHMTVLMLSLMAAGLLGTAQAELRVNGLAEPETTIAADVAGLDGAAMRGTDSAALAAINTEARLAELDQANIPNITTSTNEHFHSYEHWFGPHGTPVAEATIAVGMGTTTQTFQIDGGNNVYGAWVQIVGDTDTPHVVGKVTFQVHGILITATQRTTSAHVIQIGYGASGAAAVSAGDVLEVPYKPSAASQRSSEILVESDEAMAGTKVWARVRVIGQASGTVDFYFGIHEGSV